MTSTRAVTIPSCISEEQGSVLSLATDSLQLFIIIFQSLKGNAEIID
jgi:hypothetical protein